MKVKARSTGTIGWTLAGMVGSIFALENWGDAVAAVVCFMLVALWALPSGLGRFLPASSPFSFLP